MANLKKSVIGIVVFLVLFTLSAQENNHEKSYERITVQESDIPQGSWQCQLEFPDRQSSIDDTLSQNSLYTFDYFYGQGELFVQVPECVQSFLLFINHEQVTENFTGGKTYQIDFSKIAKTGKNILQLSSVKFSSRLSISLNFIEHLYNNI